MRIFVNIKIMHNFSDIYIDDRLFKYVIKEVKIFFAKIIRGVKGNYK